MTLQIAVGGAKPNRTAANPYAAGESAAGNLAEPYDEYPLQQRKILKHIHQLGDDAPEEGVNISSLSRALGMSIDKVREECASLAEGGTLYTTTDDDQSVFLFILRSSLSLTRGRAAF